MHNIPCTNGLIKEDDIGVSVPSGRKLRFTSSWIIIDYVRISINIEITVRFNSVRTILEETAVRGAVQSTLVR
mgnify:CR=1 FL=1